MHYRSSLGALSAAGATITLGTSFAASQLLLDYPLLLSQGTRYAIGAATLGLVMLVRGAPWLRLSRGDVARIVLLAATGLFGFNICLMAALRQSDPAAVGVIVGCVPLVLGLAGPLSRRRMPARRLLLAAALVSAGAAATQGGGASSTAGLLWALGALGGEAAFSLLAVPLLPRLGPLALSLYVSLAAAAMLLAATPLLYAHGGVPLPGAAQTTAIVYLGVVVTAGAFIAWYAGIARLGVERAGLFAGLVPIAAFVGAVLLGQAAPTPLRVLGVALVAAGVTVGLVGRKDSEALRGRRRNAKMQ